MKLIGMYPIFPCDSGCDVALPASATIINVSLNTHQYYLHALVDQGDYNMVPRRIAAYMNDEHLLPDDVGDYIGMAAQSGTHRQWHFFDQTKGGGQ